MTTGDDAGFSMVSSRFALGRPNTSGTGETAGDPPHVRGRRPYGMRFFEAVDDSGTVLPRYRYCPDQQVAVSDDGADEPLVTRIVGWDRTTSGQHDGNKGPQEEWHLDHRIES